ncbi:nitrate reductase subunit alpha [Kyrpidia tusciae]|uniref:nitrate reductase (quinone) n=1 Tax=Kyrpidia tusciae (strain DSM 2912 / NBRC 15312 / T2) TaxID=562970 RepID=D5WPV3_KYRT2|nr:nitrate reductase subunit alpha [Kyrpidia tusciae]ADG06362.1 nitrate reductase, alpha subunit [Kyrpidia tusciae DSM 2912]
MPNRNTPFRNLLLHLRPRNTFNQGWSEESVRSRHWENLYRARWQHDKVVRSTHGVNCTGSCSWKIHVKDGIIAWETQQTDYPSLGLDFPEYEPRGCARGASFSWYTYSPLRVKYPYIRGELLSLWREAKQQAANPVEAWESIVGDPEKKRRYWSARGKGGLVRTTWEEVTEIIAAATIYTIKAYGPDRVVGFSPIPAMSMVSYAAGARFLSLLGGTIISFYDWYADLPPASPQIWGEQTDVPESADWYNTKYFIIWGTNLPMTRTPDAHFMVEARYNGTKVVGVSPDYAEYIKFADLWLPAKAGTDAALAMAMTHVILKEFYADRETEYFSQYVKQYTDLPFLVTLQKRGDAFTTDRFLHASDLHEDETLGEWKTLVWDQNSDSPAIPKGSIGFRWDESGKWNLNMEDADGRPLNPVLSLIDRADEVVLVDFPYFGANQGETLRRGVPAKKLTDKNGQAVYVATVLDLLMAHCGVGRGLPGDYPKDYDDPVPYTPAWQEAITGVDRKLSIQVAREFAENAARTRGRSMIALGAGTNHWYHSDLIYRCIINLVLLTGCQGVNGGGWAHYVGQEKVRPLEGWSTVAFATDWVRPPRHMQGTTFYYFVTDQFRYEELDTATMGSPLGGRFHHMHPADMAAMAARLGWAPSYPQFEQNSLDLVDEARAHGATTDQEIVQRVVERIRRGEVKWAVEDPDNPKNFPRVFFVWRSNLMGASSKGHEYFLRHLLGADGHVLAEESTTWKPTDVKIEGQAPQGKLDLLVNIDFRMTGTGVYSDIVLPAATWYEKYDLSSTDMHPFVHPFNPAISSPWQARSDWAIFRSIAQAFSTLAEKILPARDDLVMVPLGHDTPAEIAQPDGKVRDWRKGEAEPIPGKTMPSLVIVHRDYPNVYHQMMSLGPLVEKSIVSKGISISGERAYREVAERVGTWDEEGVGCGRPSLYHDHHVVEAILTLSGATNGHRAMEEWKALERNTGLALKQIAAGREDEALTLADITAQPRLTMPTPVWSGIEGEGRRYSPFTANVDFKLPWRTLTGRQQFYLDHEVILDFGESLPLYRPPLGLPPFQPGDARIPEDEGGTVMVRYLTPHQKWGIHSTYTDTPRMLSLFRGGQTIWVSEEDAAKIGIKDNDWVEVYNRNGAIVARAVVSYRLPQGIAMMYHAQDRVIGVPGSRITKDRGGTHNSVTRVIPKPTHMVGGYAQLSYAFNYYGPTGHQRDVMAFIRPLKEVDWLES